MREKSKVLGAHGRDVLNENGKLLLGFAEDNKLAFLNTFFCTLKSGVSYTFQSANRRQGKTRLDYILTKQANHRLIRCVNVRRPPIEAPELGHNLVCAKVRIPRRSAPNRRKRDNTKETSKTAGLRRLMADPNLRRQGANAMVAALPPIPGGTCISDIAPGMADVMLSTAAELAPRSKRMHGTQGKWANPGAEALYERSMVMERGGEEAPTRRNPQQQPSRGREDGWEKSSEGLQGCRAEQTRVREGDQAGFYKHLKTMDLEGKRDHSSAYIKYEDGILLRDVDLIRE